MGWVGLGGRLRRPVGNLSTLPCRIGLKPCRRHGKEMAAGYPAPHVPYGNLSA